MTIEEVAAASTAAGHFPQFLEIDSLSDSPVVETARTRDPGGSLRAPLIRTFKDRQGRWVLTVFGEEYCHVPNEADVPEATISMLRAMDGAMNFSSQVVQQYNLIELALSDYETGDE